MISEFVGQNAEDMKAMKAIMIFILRLSGHANNFTHMWHTQQIFQSGPGLFRQSSGEFIFNLFGFLIHV